MKSYFDSGFFKSNRRRLQELFTGTAPIIIPASGIVQRRPGDNSYSFSQDPNFWYLTGIDEPDLILVMDRQKEYLIVPGRSASRQTFDGSINRKELVQVSGIKTVLDADQGWEILSERLQKVKHIATVGIPPAYIEHYGLFANPARASLVAKLRQYNKNVKLVDLTPQLSQMRAVKQPAELAAIRRAIDITTVSFREALQNNKRRDFKWEHQIEAELSRSFRRRGASGHAFEPIVAGGQRACTLHYVANTGRLAKNDWIIIDAGAEVEHYAADITRTINLGKPNRRQQQVYEAVAEAQDFALNLLKPGLLFRQYEEQVSQFLGEKLRQLGLIKKITPRNIRKYCPHATSHFLGLNVHDIGDYRAPLEAGMVLTVEPGIYIPKEGIGVRIEDDVLINKQGYKLLSADLKRQL